METDINKSRQKTKSEPLIECADGKKRTKSEYSNWMTELLMRYN